MVKIELVTSKSQWKEFIAMPWLIYKGDPNWVPPLQIAVRDLLDPKKNPFFKHAEMSAWLAYQDGKCVGRVLGVIDTDNNEYHEEKAAFFGFFEAIDSQEVADGLLNEVARWAEARGMEVVRGPLSPSTNYECGLLVEGFQDPPTVMTTYNPPYYAKLLENWGCTKVKDLFAYSISGESKFSDRIQRQAERLSRGKSVTFRSIDMKNFDQEVDRILEIYNDAWEKNWGFIPMRPEEFRHLAKDMKAIVDPRLCLIAEVRGEAVAFALTLPDVNQAIIKVKDGKLFPSGLLKLLWHLKGPARKKTINRCRILTLGIKKAYREYALGPMFYMEYFRRGPALGYPSGEASWVLEDNKPMNKALNMMCGQRTKVYRIYDRPLKGNTPKSPAPVA